MGELRIGIVGLGFMGNFHALDLLAGKVPGARLAGVTDAAPQARARARETMLDVIVYDSAESLFSSGEVEAVIITTPHFSHPPLAIRAFEAGLHVMIEKPAGAYTKQILEMNAEAACHDCVFGIMLNLRTFPVYQRMHDIVQNGELGEIKRTNYVITDWLRTQAYYDSGSWRATWEGEGGGVLLNQSPHNLDLWQWICGMPTRLRAFCNFGKYHRIEVEDDVTAYVEYPNGATGVFITSTGESPGTNVLEIVGDRGKLQWKDGTLTLWQTEMTVSNYIETNQGAFDHPSCKKIDLPVMPGENHLGILKNWVRAIREGVPLVAPGEAGLHSVELANAMLLSTWTDDWVDLPLDGDLYVSALNQRIAESVQVVA